jgi:signal transduction histidine kinase
MVLSQNSIISELQLRIKILEKQNEQMAERMEEKLLLWLAFETINHADNVNDLLENLLERISVVREIPLSACCEIDGQELKVITKYNIQNTNSEQCGFSLTPGLINQLEHGPVFIDKNSFEMEGLKIRSDLGINIARILIFPFQNDYIPKGIFLFAEEEIQKDSISDYSLVLQEIIKTAMSKYEKLIIAEELKLLKGDLEKKLEERTLQLRQYTEQLKQEISDRKNNEEQLRIEKEEAQKSEELKSYIIDNLRHEVRTPLNGILGFSEMLRKGSLLEHERNDYLDFIKISGKSLLQIVDDICDLSDIESNKISLNITDFQASQFMTSLYNFYRKEELYNQKEGVELKLNLNFNGTTLFRLDKQKLWKILANLINNALKFTEKGTVEFGCNIEDNGIYESGLKDLLFYVRDTGIGIPQNKHSVVFDRFTKIDHDINKQYGGSGLGLTIVKELIELMGGRVWFESIQGEGTTFFFAIPESVMIVKNKSNQLTYGELAEKFQWKNRLVLIVEDDEMSYIYLKEVLKNTHIKILRAADGEEAVKLVHQHPDIDLVLMDIKLPVMDGYEATRKIKEYKKQIPIIAQTAYAMADDKEKSFEVGCDDYITKPINRQRLLDAMNVVLAN